MPQEDEMQVGVFYRRAAADEGQGAIPIELGGGEGNLVRIWACHWNFEDIPAFAEHVIFLGAAISSNPEHEVTPLFDFQDFQLNKALYARALIISDHDGEGDSTVTAHQQIIPCYGLVRPRRQIMVSSIIGIAVLVGIGLEVYYQPFSALQTEREEVNRKFGKYRRS